MESSLTLAARAQPAVPVSVPLQLSPLQTEALLASKLNELCAGITAWALPVVVGGVLGEIPPARYGTAYKIPLIDPDNPASAIYLNAKETLLTRAGVRRGDVVRVVGSIAGELFRGNVSFRLVAVAIEHQAATAVPEARGEHLTLETLRRLTLDRRPFPTRIRPTITLIHSAASSARVADDFADALNAAVPLECLVRVPCSMHDPAGLATAIRGITTDILVIVRGGGDPEEFGIFEDASLLEALAECSSYRVLGLGHSANRTLAELVADHAASTPAAAGEHVRRGIIGAMRLVRTEGLNQNLREALAEKERQIEQDREPLRLEPLEMDTLPRAALHAAGKGLIPPAAWWMLLGALGAWGLLRLL